MCDPLLTSVDVDAVRRRYECEKPQRVDRAFRSWLLTLTGAALTCDYSTRLLPNGGFYLRLQDERVHEIRVTSSIDRSTQAYVLGSDALSLLASVLAFSELSILYPEDYRKLRDYLDGHPDARTMRAIEIRLYDYIA